MLEHIVRGFLGARLLCRKVLGREHTTSRVFVPLPFVRSCVFELEMLFVEVLEKGVWKNENTSSLNFYIPTIFQKKSPFGCEPM